jgi:hypothetical protein
MEAQGFRRCCQVRAPRSRQLAQLRPMPTRIPIGDECSERKECGHANEKEDPCHVQRENTRRTLYIAESDRCNRESA